MSDPKRPIQKTRRFKKLAVWARRIHLGRKLAILLTVFAAVSGIATYAALTGSGPLGPEPKTVLFLLNIDLFLLLMLSTVLVRHLVKLWVERRKGAAGSRLHVRIVLMFALIASMPTILVAVFSALFFNIGLQAWFSTQVHTAVKESLVVAEAYMNEHRQMIAGDVLVLANDLNRDWMALMRNPKLANRYLADRSFSRGLDEVVLFDSTGKVHAKAGFTFSMSFEEVPIWAMEKADNGDVAIITGETADRVRALVRLHSIGDAYLYVGRFVDATVLKHVERAQKAVADYEKLEGKRSELEITFSMIFIVAALLLLMASVWLGMILASQLAKPVVALINAAEKVREGDLTVKVEEHAYADEVSVLSRAFNRMTGQLSSQREELVKTNREIDQRRRFMETVLAGVSAGVVGLDKQGCIIIANRSACVLMGWDINEKKGRPLVEVVFELAEAFEQVKSSPEKPFSGEIKYQGRTLLVRLAAESAASRVVGFVFTFDDITELEAAQRKAAWADVARRIAHEIKNPLTPIQLSAERLKRKYLKQIEIDPETFETCTNTIIRHVTDIGCMVDEFSSFARMPAPVRKQVRLGTVLRESVMLQKTAYNTIDFTVILHDNDTMLNCDRKQLSQVLTNCLKNAIEAVKARSDKADKGQISVTTSDKGDAIEIAIEDNGCGLPENKRDRLTEPYVTTRAKGTGLGLAIVKKIMEDHGGDIILEDRLGPGARVRLVFPAG